MKPDSVYFDPRTAATQQEQDRDYLNKKEKEERKYEELGKLIGGFIVYLIVPLFIMLGLNYIFPALSLNYIKSFILYNIILLIK